MPPNWDVKVRILKYDGYRPYLLLHPCDCIIYYSPSIFFGKLVAKLKSVWNVPAYLILRDIFPEWTVDANIIGRGLIYWYLHRKELQTYRAANVIGVQSPGNLNYFKNKNWAKDLGLEVLYNWFNPDNVKSKTTYYREKLNLQNKIIFTYGGNMGAAQEMFNILFLAKKLFIESKAHFLLVGDGSEVKRIKQYIVQEKLSNITVLPGVSQEEFYGILFESDVGLISLARDLTIQNLPGKFLSYLYAGLPTLASLNVGNDLEGMLKEYEVGYAAVSGDAPLLLQHAKMLIDHEEQRRLFSNNAKHLLQTVFSIKKAAASVMQALSLGHLSK